MCTRRERKQGEENSFKSNEIIYIISQRKSSSYTKFPSPSENEIKKGKTVLEEETLNGNRHNNVKLYVTSFLFTIIEFNF